MEPKKRIPKKAFVLTDLCVSCGCCVKVCPRAAISICQGIFAQVNMETCIGCKKCVKECPASVIEVREVPA